jgi:Pectate lyase superfamily protein
MTLSTLVRGVMPDLLMLLLLSAGLAFAEIIPANRIAPWQGNVGVPGGIPARTTICKNIVTDLGADPTGAQDCAPIIQRAINSCPAGQVVYMPAGTFRLNSRVYLASRQNFTLRGAGVGVTIIKSMSNGYFLFGSQQWPPPSTWVPITAGATKGSNTITVADTSAFVVDQLMNIGPAAMPVWTHNLGGYPDTISNMRVAFKVRGKTATTVTFDPPCPFDFSGMNPSARPFKGPADGYHFIQGIGLEDFTMDLTNSSAPWAIEIDQAWGCWVKNIELNHAYSRQMRFGSFVRGEVRHCYTHDSGSGPNHEGIDFDGDCCWNLVEDSICNKGGASPIQFGDSTGANSCNVVAYNYVVNTDPGFWDISFNHSPHNMLNLAEGNVIDNYKDDGYFGSSSHNTLFRNRIRYNLELKHFSNYYNIVGNVLGTIGFSNGCETEQVNYGNNPVYALGFPNIGNHSYSGTFGPTTPPNYSANGNNLTDPENQTLDLNVEATILRHGNFDYFNNSAVWDSSISDHTIPDSLYLKGKPSWWDQSPWPPIGPDRTPMVSQIPAEYRFVNGRPIPPPTSSATPSSPQNPQIKNNNKKQYNKKKPKIQKQKWPSALLQPTSLSPSSGRVRADTFLEGCDPDRMVASKVGAQSFYANGDMASWQPTHAATSDTI